MYLSADLAHISIYRYFCGRPEAIKSSETIEEKKAENMMCVAAENISCITFDPSGKRPVRKQSHQACKGKQCHNQTVVFQRQLAFW